MADLDDLFGKQPAKKQESLDNLFGGDSQSLGQEDKLSRLLGGNESAVSGDNEIDALLSISDLDEKRFCRLCEYCFFDAFSCKCDLHHREVEPLSDCSDFVPRLVPEKEKDKD